MIPVIRLRLALVLALWGALSAPPAYAVFADVDNLVKVLQESVSTSGLELLAKRLGEQTVTGAFRDVDQNAWYAPYVTKMVQRSIVSGDMDQSGKPKGTFRPGDYVTVAEALKIVFRAARINELQCDGIPRNTMGQTHWSRPFVICGEGLGVRLLATDIFLDRAISRSEVVGLIDDVFGDVVPPSDFSPFKDISTNPYRADIAYNAELGIITGDTTKLGQLTGFFRPNDSIRRSEIVKVVAIKIEKTGL